MTHIPRDQWIKNTFMQMTADTELLRLPEMGYQELTDKEKDKLRQTEVFNGEIVQLLGKGEHFNLVRKFEGTLGWVPRSSLTASSANDFEMRLSPRISPESFIQNWLGTPYVWGGLSPKGIDCSGFTQLYYLDVHHMVLPKNSFDQRKLGGPSSLENLKDHDLIFCYAHDQAATHHVVLYYQGCCWHARRKGGIVRQELAEFIPQFRLEEARTYLS